MSKAVRLDPAGREFGLCNGSDSLLGPPIITEASGGNPKISVVATSACATPALCGEKAPSR